MPSGYANVPAESSVLCESCGYTLDGLDPSGKCPECGTDIANSRQHDGRTLPSWEDTQATGWVGLRFWRTTARIIFRTHDFYRTLATRQPNRLALRFARLHWAISANLTALALWIHVDWLSNQTGARVFWRLSFPLFWLAAVCGIYLAIWGTTALASRLTAWEAGYRGIRLPLPVVRRGMYYHSAQYLPVSLLALAATSVNWLLFRRGVLGPAHVMLYLYALCALVPIAAVYLFTRYWTGMKAMMYANR